MVSKCYDKVKIAEWLKANIDKFSVDISDPTKYVCMGLEKDDELIAACMFESWENNAICIHMASKKGYGKYWLDLYILNWIYDYPFNQINCDKVIARIYQDNVACLRWAKRAKFEVEKIIDNIVIMTLSKENCLWR